MCGILVEQIIRNVQRHAAVNTRLLTHGDLSLILDED